METAPETAAPVVAPAAAPAAAPVAAEPVAAPAAVEPTAAPEAAPAAEPVVEAPAFPSADDYGWDEFDGETFDALPEEARGWVERSAAFYNKRHETTLAERSRDGERWKAMYDAIAMGDEDPRIAEMTQDAAVREAAYQAIAAENKSLQDAMRQMNEDSSSRYMDDFEKKYGEKMQANPEAVERSFQLLDAESSGKDDDRFFEPHVAFEIGMLGDRAISDALALWAKGWQVEAIEEVINARFKGSTAPTAVPATPKPRPSAAVVAGGGQNTARKPQPAPVKRPQGAELLTPGNMMAAIRETIKQHGG